MNSCTFLSDFLFLLLELLLFYSVTDVAKTNALVIWYVGYFGFIQILGNFVVINILTISVYSSDAI